MKKLTGEIMEFADSIVIALVAVKMCIRDSLKYCRRE